MKEWSVLTDEHSEDNLEYTKYSKYQMNGHFEDDSEEPDDCY